MERTIYDKQLGKKRDKLRLDIEEMERQIRYKVEQHLLRQKESLFEKVDLLITKMQADVQRSATTTSQDDRQRAWLSSVSEKDHNGNHSMEIKGPQLLVNGSPLNRSFPIRYVLPNLQELRLEDLTLGEVELISASGSCPASSRVQKERLAVPGNSRMKVASETSRHKPVLTRNGPANHEGDQGDENLSSDNELEDGQDYTNVPRRGHDVKKFTPTPAQRTRIPPIPAQRQKDAPRARSHSLESSKVLGHSQNSAYMNVTVSNDNRRMQPTRTPPVLRAMSADTSVQHSRVSRRHESDREAVKIIHGTVCLAVRK